MVLSSERLAARKRHLVQTAQALIRERGNAGFSMSLLAERAGLSATTPYNLFGSKSEILRYVIREDTARFVGKLAEHAGETPLAALLGATDALVDHYEADRQFHIGLFRAASSADAPVARGILSMESWAWWKALVQAAIDSGEVAGFMQADQLTDALTRMMGSVAQAWLAEGWAGKRFALEMSLGVRLVLASVSVPPCATAMIGEITDLQIAIQAVGSTEQSSRTLVKTRPKSPIDRRAILASRAVIVAFRLFEQVARDAALTIPQYRFLLMLKRGPRRASDLAEFSGIGRSTASALITDMERRGLVFRTRDDGDGRAADLRVTEEGLRRYARLEGELAQALETLVIDSDRGLVLDAMARFSEGIDRLSRARSAH